MNSSFLEQFKREVLDTSSDLTMDTQLSEIEEWDSLAVASFMAITNKNFGVNVSRSQVLRASTVQDLYDMAVT